MSGCQSRRRGGGTWCASGSLGRRGSRELSQSRCGIAAAAAHHYRVDKTIEKDRTYTSIDELDRKDRMTELARLISGRRVTQASLETAKEMLESYQNSKKEKK